MPENDTTLVRFAAVRRFPNAAPLAVGAVMAAGISAIDWATGPDVSFALLHVFAVMTVTWLGRRWHGIFIAAMAAASSSVVYVAKGGLWANHLWNAVTILGVLVLVSVLLGALRSSLLTQRIHATQDPLTGALNRRAFHVIAERERMRAGRDGSPLSLAYFDIDDFKAVNDTRGHAAGDELLASFADSVSAAVRGTDLFARIGGDEFILMLPATDARQAMLVIDRVRAILADAGAGTGHTLTTSVGLATYRFPPSTVDAMITGSDDLMYQAKSRGGDTVVGMVFIGPWTRWSQTMEDAEPKLRAPIGTAIQAAG